MKTKLLLLLGLIVATPLFAVGNGFTRFTFEGKGAKLGSSANFGWLGGLGYRCYVGATPLSLGLGATFGVPAGGGNGVANDNLLYAGFPIHIDGHLSKVLVYDLGIMVAYSQGTVITPSSLRVQSTGWVLEQSLAFGVSLGSGWRLSASPGYLYSFNSSEFTGFLMGIRLERKALTTTSGKDF